MRKRIVVAALGALGTALAAGWAGNPAIANGDIPLCDFTTGGGYIFPAAPAADAKGTFGVGGGCKHSSGLGDPPGPYWGHLQYHDHGVNLKVQWTSVTAYMVDTVVFPDPRARLTCGTARTNFGDVDFVVRTKDAGLGPGTDDEFDIQLIGAVVYSTFAGGPHKLGGGIRGGGNIQLHKPNGSNTGIFGGSCPALPPPPPQGADVSVTKTTTTGEVEAGTPISFDIVVHNAGPGVATDVTLTDALPRGPEGSVTWTINPSVSGCQIEPTTQVLTCMFDSLDVGEEITIHVEADPAPTECSAASGPPTFVNEVSVAATNETAGTQANNTSVATIRANCIE